MRIAVLGAGAMGSLFGGLLATAGEEVTLITRNAEHAAAIEENGLRIVDVTGAGDDERDQANAIDKGGESNRTDSTATRVIPVPATTDPETVGVVDVVIVFVKSYATAQAMADATPLVGPETTVVTLQNGLGNAETIAEFVPADRILVGVTTHGAMHEAPGRVHHTGAGDTALGRWRGPTDERTRAVAARLTASGIETEVVDDPTTRVWEKVLVNVGINAPTALARVENGALAATAPGRALLEAAVSEAATIARERGHDVREDIVAYTREVASRTATNHSSMRVDLESGQPTEVRSLYGAVLERAADVGIDAPVVRTLARLVRLAETRSQSEDGPHSDE